MTQWGGEAPEADAEAPGMPDSDGQRRMKSFTVDLPASLYRRFKLACMDRTMAEEVLALIERRTEEMEVATAMERFTAAAGERGMVLGELLEHALHAFAREQDWMAEAPTGQRLRAGVSHDVAACDLVGAPGRREAA
jgi:hypothetical protein